MWCGQAGYWWLACLLPLKNCCTHWASKWDSLEVNMCCMSSRDTRHLPLCPLQRCGSIRSRYGRWYIGSSLPHILCTHHLMVLGRRSWRQTPVGSWGRCLTTCTLRRGSTPTCTFWVCAVPPRAASMLGQFPLLTGQTRRWGGSLRGRHIDQAEG